MKTINIKENDQNIRLDNFIKKVFPNLTLSQVFKSIRIGKIKVNNKKAKFNYLLKLNDVITCYIQDIYYTNNSDKLFLLAKDDLEIIYEDDNILVINKPAKLLSVDEENKTADTLINRAKKYLFMTKKWQPELENQFQPCLVHRLDFNTTGLIIVAKNHASATILSQKIKNKEIDKYYVCLVYGKMKKKHDILEAYLIRNHNNNFSTIVEKPLVNAKHIKTEYKVLEYYKSKNISKLEIKLITGRTHQIRAHLAYIGHPLVGEHKYKTKNIKINDQYKHQALTAYKIKFCFKNLPKTLNYLNNITIKLKNVSFKILK